ncbi:hypothetical protein QQ045_021333 [Rhodiola kirilowii]
MSDRAVQPHPNSSEMSGKYSSMKQSGWIGHWMPDKYKRPRDGNLCVQREDGHEMKKHSLSCDQVPEPSGTKSFSGVRERVDRSMEVINRFPTDGSHLKKERSDLLSFPIINVLKKGGASRKQVPGTQTGQHNEFNAAATGTIKPHSAYVSGGQGQVTESATIGCKFLPKETIPNLEMELRSRDSVEGGCMPAVKSFRGKLPDMPSGYPYGIMCRKEKAIPYASTSKEHLTYRSSYQDFNVETMRISSTLDAREGIHIGSPMYTETTRHFFITEKTAIGVSDEGKIFRESMFSTKFNGNLGGLLSLSPASGQVRPGLKLQLLDGSTDSEQKDRGSEENQKDEHNQSIGRLDTVTGVVDETSAETRTMEVDISLENNHHRGLAISRLNEDMLRGQSTMSSQGKSANIELPDMNEAALAPDLSANEGEPCTSRTQSLDMECLISREDYPSNSKSITHRVVHPQPEVGSRWVKRLKLSGSHTNYVALGTKSSKIEEASSYEKLRKLSSNLFNHSIGLTSSEPTSGTHLRHTSESKKISEVPNLSNDVKASSTELLKLDRKTLLSHPWIRRWSRDQTTSLKKQPVPTEPSETQKTSSDHFEKKAFPSIAAMALMGKAMNGFRPCEFTKKGSFIVWNTDNLPSH